MNCDTVTSTQLCGPGLTAVGQKVENHANRPCHAVQRRKFLLTASYLMGEVNQARQRLTCSPGAPGCAALGVPLLDAEQRADHTVGSVSCWLDMSVVKTVEQI